MFLVFQYPSVRHLNLLVFAFGGQSGFLLCPMETNSCRRSQANTDIEIVKKL